MILLFTVASMIESKTLLTFASFCSLRLPTCGQLIISPPPTNSTSYTSTDDLSTTSTLSTSSGPIGTILILTGADFSNSQIFSVGGTLGVINSNSSTSLVVLVMPGVTVPVFSSTA